MPAVTIRPAEFDDLDALYAVCVRTGAAGADATGRYRDPDLLGHVYVGPYVMLEAGCGLVAVQSAADGDTVVGYALGAADTPAFDGEAAEAWWPVLRQRHPRSGSAEPSADDAVIELIHAPSAAPRELLAEYPAHLHIDLLPDAQGHGLGRRLIGALEVALADAGAIGVHLGVDPANVRAIGFYEHLGYRRLQPGELGTGPDEVRFVKSLR